MSKNNRERFVFGREDLRNAIAVDHSTEEAARMKSSVTSAWNKVVGHVYQTTPNTPSHSETCECGLEPLSVKSATQKLVDIEELDPALDYLAQKGRITEKHSETLHNAAVLLIEVLQKYDLSAFDDPEARIADVEFPEAVDTPV